MKSSIKTEFLSLWFYLKKYFIVKLQQKEKDGKLITK